MVKIDTQTRVCAVIGNPVEHSLSPVMHNAAIEAAGLNYVYVAFRVEDVAGCLAGMRALEGFRGMSVTIPHKAAVIAHLDEIEPMAQNVGSVNTITNDDGKLTGSTTDGPGALRSLRDAGVSLDGKRVLFIGSGGAVRAVAFQIADRTRAERITVLGRTPARLEKLIADLEAKTTVRVEGGYQGSDMEAAMASHDVVIQGTPVGMYPDSVNDTPVDAALFRPEQVVFDMVYRPLETRFIREAAAAGCKTVLGVEMLVNQAVYQFERWTGVDAPVKVMRDALISALR